MNQTIKKPRPRVIIKAGFVVSTTGEKLSYERLKAVK